MSSGTGLALAAALALLASAASVRGAAEASAGEALHAACDVDADGADEMLEVRATPSESGGERIELVLRGGDGAERRAQLALPAPAQLRAARSVAGWIELDLVEVAPGDPACCPGDLVTRSFVLVGERLQEDGPPRATGRLAPDTLAGREWVLHAWSDGSRAPAEPELTLVFADGRFAGSSGCNRWFAEVKPGTKPGEISLGPIGGTLMACEPPRAALEARYLAELAGAKRLGFAAGQLALEVERGGDAGTLRFEPRPLRVAATCVRR